MRLKTLRKERPAFETEGTFINGSRMDLSRNDLKPTKCRSNTSFATPTSLYTESSLLNRSLSDQIHEMNIRSRSCQQIVIPTSSPPSSIPSYRAIETAYFKQGIRVRLSPTRTIQQSGRKSVANIQRHSAFVNRNPIRTSSVLHYTTNNFDQHHDSRSFSALQQSSSHDFEQSQTPNVSYAQSLQINEEIHDDYLSPSIIASENSNPITSPEKIPIRHDITSTATLYDDDPDLAYMSSLLKQSSGDSFLETIRRRAGLRGTFSIHRNPLASNTPQPNQQSREKSPNINRHVLTRTSTTEVVPAISSNKIDRDILKHASRIRRISQSKDYSTRSPRDDTSPIVDSSSKQNSSSKPLKSISLEPLELILSRPPRSGSLQTRGLPSIMKSSKPRKKKSSSKSAKLSTIENGNSTNFLSTEQSTYASLLSDESLSLMKTSPIDMARQSNSFDSGCYERSSSSVDVLSLASSSIVRVPSSIPSTRLTNSAAHRPNTSKRVSFYEEPSAVILTTATYV